MASILKVDTIQDQSGNNIINENADTITIGASGDTITIPAGATISNLGTASGFGGTNTPAFEARLSNEPSVPTATWTKVPIDVEIYDVGSCYDNSTNYRFTPTTAGKYVFYVQVGFNSLADGNYLYASVYKNGSQIWTDANAINQVATGLGAAARYTISAEANGTTDYFEAYGQHNYGSNRNFTAGWCFFGGYKLIE
jgi:hypothetical protein